MSRWKMLAVFAALGLGACATPESRRERSLGAAEEALAVGDVERATEVLRSALSFDPRDRQVALRLAQVHEDSRDYRQALRLLTAFPEEVRDPRWLNLRARLLLRCGPIADGARLSVALAERGAAETATFQTLSDLVVRGRLGAEQVSAPPALWVLRLAERLLEVDQPVAALSWLEHHEVASDPARDRLAEALAEAALESHDRGFVRRVERLLESPESPLGLLLQRRAAVLAGREAQIARLDARFLASFPEHPGRAEPLVAEAHRTLARGDVERALELADEALTLDGDSVRALIVRGLSLEWSGRTEEGRAALRTALALDPENRVARAALRSSRTTPEAFVMRVESVR